MRTTDYAKGAAHAQSPFINYPTELVVLDVTLVALAGGHGHSLKANRVTSYEFSLHIDHASLLPQPPSLLPGISNPDTSDLGRYP